MKSDDYLKISISHYARLTDGTPYGLILNEDRELVGVFIVLHGLNTLKKYCFDPRKNKWVTLGDIEQKRKEIIGESGKWDSIPLFARDNPWQIVCLSLTKEHAAFVKELIDNNVKFTFDDENVKTYISEEE